jgi:hypothetical protein
MEFDIFGWNKIKGLKIKNNNGIIITYDNLQSTMAKINQSYSYINTPFGNITNNGTLKLLIESSDIINLILTNKNFSIELEYKESIIVKNRKHKIVAEIKTSSSSSNFITIEGNMTTGNYEYNLLANEDGNFINLNLVENGIQYIKEDEDKKIIVNEPSVVYILKDKETSKNYRGYARCLEEDKFNDNIGIDIARLKAEIKKKEYQLSKLIH